VRGQALKAHEGKSLTHALKAKLHGKKAQSVQMGRKFGKGGKSHGISVQEFLKRLAAPLSKREKRIHSPGAMGNRREFIVGSHGSGSNRKGPNSAGQARSQATPTKNLTPREPLNNKAFLIRAPVAQADRAIAF
jgi:hypothetical protein